MALLPLAVAASDPVFAADPPKRRIELNSERIGVVGLHLAESEKPTYWQTASVVAPGGGQAPVPGLGRSRAAAGTKVSYPCHGVRLWPPGATIVMLRPCILRRLAATAEAVTI